MFLFLQWTISGKLPRSYGKQLFCSPMESFAFWFCVKDSLRTRAKQEYNSCARGARMDWKCPRGTCHASTCTAPVLHDDDNNLNVTNLHIWQRKTLVLARFWRTFLFLKISQTLWFTIHFQMTFLLSLTSCFALNPLEWTGCWNF